MKTTIEKPRKCDYCNSKPIIYDHARGVVVQCQGCDRASFGRTEEDAIKHWHKEHAQPF